MSVSRPAAILFFLAASLLPAADSVTPGRFVVERPTLICLGFEWHIAGDDNRNAVVEVSYRGTGERNWKPAMPLFRLGGEKVTRPDLGLDYTTPDMFAGSILDLEPGAAYEARFRMLDPDGVRGETVHTVTVRTRAEPKEAPDGRILHVYPPGWKGPKQTPAFLGLKEAYFGSGHGDWAVLSERRVRPGDIILVHAGLYKETASNIPARSASISMEPTSSPPKARRNGPLSSARPEMARSSSMATEPTNCST